MGLTGLFLITFLIVHCGVNALIFLNDGGATFKMAAHFMGTNPLIRFVEIGLVAGFLIHIVDGYLLLLLNKKSRPQDYAHVNASANSSWYSRSMGILGTLLLLFLIIHTGDFWIPNRSSQFTTGKELELFEMMQKEFQQPFVVFIYLAGCFSLFWHLMHGFKSAFQSLGLNHPKYNGFIEKSGLAFSIIVPILFALMPIGFYFGWVK